MVPHLLFLGTSDSKGVPRIGCDCLVCREALPGTRNFRTRAGLLLCTGEEAQAGRLLIDTPPELRLRLAEEHLPLPRALFLTHPHDDHILGISDLLRAFRSRRRSCPIFAPAEVLAGLRARFAYLWEESDWQACMELNELNEAVTVAGWQLEAVRVPHGRNGWAYGYLIEREGWRAGYFSDVIGADEEVRARWQGLDLLILGANYWQEEVPLHQRSVYDAHEAVAVATEANVSQLILTHLSHGVDFAEADRYLPAWASLAWDGRVVAATRH